jgi:CRISPR-associated protein Cas2
MLYVIAYDIPDDSRRAHIADTLKDFGRRVQYSVFEAQLDGALLAALRQRVERIVDLEDDSVRIYALCGECEDKVTIIGRGRRTTEEKLYVV